MKKLVLTAMLVAMTAFGLTACGSKAEEAAPAEEAAVVEEATDAAETEEAPVEEAAVEEAPAEDAQAEAAAEPSAEEIKSLAEKVKVALDAKDLDSLSTLVAYPAYVGIEEGSVVETADDFKALGDAVITPELVAAVDAVDMDSLTMTEAGVVLGDGAPNVTLGVAEDGTFGITGINY